MSKEYYDEYKNKIFPNNSHIYIRAYDAASSYYCHYPMTGSKTEIWDCILNCCCEYPGMKAPYLDSSKHLYRFLAHVIKQNLAYFRTYLNAQIMD